MSHCHHHHGHGGHQHTDNQKILWLSFCLIALFMIVEFVGGLLTNSLALLADSGHMLSDASAIALSIGAIWMGKKQANRQYTFGFRRAETLAALINGLSLVGISVYILVESVERFQHPLSIHSQGMFLVALIGFFVNLIVAYLLHKGDIQGNLNMKSAYLHVLGDLLGSVAAIVSSVFIYLYQWNAADAIASGLVAVLILISGYKVVKEALHLLMEGVPSDVSIDKMEQDLMNIQGVEALHQLHVSGITSDYLVIHCHLVIKESNHYQEVLHHATHLLKEHYFAKKTTVQVEISGYECI